MIKPWIFEFLHAPGGPGAEVAPKTATAVFDAGVALWQHIESLGFEGIFFSEHHFGLSYSPSPNLLIASIARPTRRLRLGTMGMVLPLYQPWRILEEIGMLDHLTGGRLEIGCASGVPQEMVQVGLRADENRGALHRGPGDSRRVARPARDLASWQALEFRQPAHRPAPPAATLAS
jgi:alkanesulfonate monooxygenase SsuD/methylene tetrahydromethanopterin reductase-like flavin-dependent oxidoreductase (luciferase family)